MVRNDCEYPECTTCTRADCEKDANNIHALLMRRLRDKDPELYRKKQREYRARKKPHRVTPEQKVYRFLVDYVEQHMYPPSVREIAKGIGLKSQSNIPEYLGRLKDLGLIDGDPDKSRAIRLVGYRIVKDGETDG